MAEEEIKRFGGGSKPHRFYIGDSDDVFVAAAKIPAESMVELVEQNEELLRPGSDVASSNGTGSKSRRQFEVALGMMKMVLFEESYRLFEERLASKEDPVDLRDVIDIMQWLLGDAYGLRPTQQSSSSGDTSADGGESSMAGALDDESTQESSPGTGTSILSTTGS